MDKRRVVWLDQARGWCIVLVLLGHISTLPSYLWALIYSFHMPFFFMASGFLWDDLTFDKYGFKEFLIKKFNGLIIPYLKISTICMVIWGIIVPMATSPDHSVQPFFLQMGKYLLGIVYSYGDVDYMPKCSPIWFLTAFFCSSLYFYSYRRIILRFKNKGGADFIGLLIIAFVGYLSTLAPKMPWNIDTAIIGCFFMGIGYEIKKIKLYKYFRFGFIIPIVLCVFYYIYQDIPVVSMNKNRYEGYWLILPICIITCLFVFQFFYAFRKYLSKGRFLEYFSFNSIGYFGYDGSTMVLGLIPYIGNHWLVFWLLKVVILTLFVKVVNRLKIRKLFY